MKTLSNMEHDYSFFLYPKHPKEVNLKKILDFSKSLIAIKSNTIKQFVLFLN